MTSIKLFFVFPHLSTMLQVIRLCLTVVHKINCKMIGCPTKQVRVGPETCYFWFTSRDRFHIGMHCTCPHTDYITLDSHSNTCVIVRCMLQSMWYGHGFTTAVCLTKNHTGPTPTWQLSNSEAIIVVGLLQQLPQSRLTVSLFIVRRSYRDCFYMRCQCYVGQNTPGLVREKERERGRRER